MRLRDWHKRIVGLIAEAKDKKEMTDSDLASSLDMSEGTIRNMKCKHELFRMDFWRIVAIAELAGYEVRFERR